DQSPAKKAVIQQIADQLKLNPFQVMPRERLKSTPVTNLNVSDFVYPSPAEWLKGFQDAKFVITDSFHGTVFSILYNVPFIAIGNASRGLARFESILSLFGLENRLLVDCSKDNIKNVLDRVIAWDKVNEVLVRERTKSHAFLDKYLS